MSAIQFLTCFLLGATAPTPLLERSLSLRFCALFGCLVTQPARLPASTGRLAWSSPVAKELRQVRKWKGSSEAENSLGARCVGQVRSQVTGRKSGRTRMFYVCTFSTYDSMCMSDLESVGGWRLKDFRLSFKSGNIVKYSMHQAMKLGTLGTWAQRSQSIHKSG